MSADELWRLPDDGMRRELVEGELRVMTPAGFEHGRVAWALAGLLFEHVGRAGSGAGVGAETGFLLARDPDTVRAPDAAYISDERLEAVGRTERYWPGPPDLAAEVISPEDSFGEVEAKAFQWLDAGCKAVLVLDPSRRAATVYRSREDVRAFEGSATVDLSDAVPGWKLSLADVFR